MVRNQRDEVIHLEAETSGGAVMVFGANAPAENGTANVSISNVAPAGVTTATIAKWLPINIDGVNYYIPMWT